MHLPYSFLTLGAAAACWTLAGLCHDVPYSADEGLVEAHNPLGICRSAYGSQIARLMKDSLHSYWHAGCTDPSHHHAPETSAETTLADRLAVGHDHDEHDHAEHAEKEAHEPPAKLWVDRWGRNISGLEQKRVARNSPFAVAAAHKRFLEAAADWRVHVAWLLDPGDAALY